MEHKNCRVWADTRHCVDPKRLVIEWVVLSSQFATKEKHLCFFNSRYGDGP